MAAAETSPLRLRTIFAFWSPMAATWLMMAAEGPFLAAVIARLPDPTHNLAAFGVAYAFALIAEAPVIMMLSAATALVEDGDSLRRLRAFCFALCVAVTGIQAAFVATPVFSAVTRGLMDLPAPVADLTRTALLILLPWPAAIGYRRFYQGLLIRGGSTRLVAAGTVVRLTTMAATGLAAYRLAGLPGASAGALALSVGVIAEALASRVMARRVVVDVAHRAAASVPALTLARIVTFYLPLALTSTIGLAVHPLVTFFLGHSRAALESLAVFPVVNALGFIFRCAGLSYQEVAIALLAGHQRDERRIRRFAVLLGLAASAGMAAIAWTPLSDAWYRGLSGLSGDLASLAVVPTRILAVLPFLSVILAYQRALLVHGRSTGPISRSTAVEVAVIAALLWLGIDAGTMVGVTAAAAAFLGGRLAGNLWLVPPCLRVVRRLPRRPPATAPSGRVLP